MADDLSDLDVTQPAAGDAVSLGDDAIRDTRRQTRNWADVEHHRTGQHKIPSGAAEPAAGFAGHLFLNTSLNRLSRDDGTIWRLMNVVPFGFSHTAGSVVIATGVSYTLLQTITIAIPNGAARLIILGGLQLLMTPLTTVDNAEVKFQFDGSDITQPPKFDFNAVQNEVYGKYHTVIGVVDNPAAGIKNATMLAKVSASNPVASASNRLLLGVII